MQQIASEMSSRDCSYHNLIVNTCTNQGTNSQMIVGGRILQDLQGWLTPPDPSTNHDIAYSSQHERTAVWVFKENIYQEWESSGALLWLHGKGLSLCSRVDMSEFHDGPSSAGSGKSILWFVTLLSPYTGAHIIYPQSALQSSSISLLCAKPG